MTSPDEGAGGSADEAVAAPADGTGTSPSTPATTAHGASGEAGGAGEQVHTFTAADLRFLSRRDPDDPRAVLAGKLPNRVVVELVDEPRDALPSTERRERDRAARRRGERHAHGDEDERRLAILTEAADLPISVVPDRFVTPDAIVHTIGSCFAVNVRRVLRAHGLIVHPMSDEVDLWDDRQWLGFGRALNHYDTFTIRQEFERALDPGAPGFDPVRAFGRAGGREANPRGDFWQDACRMMVFGADEEAMVDLTAKLDASVRTAVASADVFIISLGLIETWVDVETGRHAWGAEVREVAPDPDRYRFHLSTYEENLDNVRWICRALAEHRPGCRVVLTVSPVGLGRTFSGRDITVANTYSKSLLRTVAGAVEAEMDHVTYWPSYEMAVRGNLFDVDQRHVTDEGVAYIMERFLAAHAAA